MTICFGGTATWLRDFGPVLPGITLIWYHQGLHYPPFALGPVPTELFDDVGARLDRVWWP